MPKIRLILIALFGMFLLGCATNGKRNPAFPGKKLGIRCGKNAPIVHAECFEAQEKVQQARRKHEGKKVIMTHGAVRPVCQPNKKKERSS